MHSSSTLLWSPELFGLGVPPSTPSWAFLLSGMTILGRLVGIVGYQSFWFLGSTLWGGCQPLVGGTEP